MQQNCHPDRSVSVVEGPAVSLPVLTQTLKPGPNATHKGKPRASVGDVGKVNPQHFGILLPFIIE
jgi:hypothetical protein